jgi:putative ABC transport system substrate-binding protein
MNRREVVTRVGGAAVSWVSAPFVTRAQTAIPMIGFLHAGDAETYSRPIAAFRQGLAEIGYVEGQNVAIEYRWAEGQPQRLPALTADLVARRVSVIVTGATVSALAAKSATSTIPIVFLTSDNPVSSGLVASLNRPGGNATGVNFLLNELGSKRLEIVRELVPAAGRIGLLVNPGSPPGAAASADLEALAQRLGLAARVEYLRAERDIAAAFAALAEWKADAAMVVPDGLVFTFRRQLANEASRRSIATIYPLRDFVVAGGLLSYGTSIAETFKLMGSYAGRILKGEKPADLPVQQSAKFELVINLPTAKALGLDIPPTLLARADEVIE